jgi:hypothetical protein
MLAVIEIDYISLNIILVQPVASSSSNRQSTLHCGEGFMHDLAGPNAFQQLVAHTL